MAGLLLFDPQYSNLWLFNKENHDSPITDGVRMI